MPGIYIHIPFCSRFCIYCDFFSLRHNNTRTENFLEALEEEIRGRRSFFTEEQEIVTLYIGGGTPSLLSPGQVGRIYKTLTDTFGKKIHDSMKEFTIEVNPDDVDLNYLRELKNLGINRLSMGVQSFCDDQLRWMNRRHNYTQAIKAFYDAREAGFDNISLDLIFGIGDKVPGNWKLNLEKVIKLRPEHISAYQLGIEKGTVLAKMVERGEYSPANDELSATQYTMLQNSLREAGYHQYEISNFALDNRESLHNSSYWNHTPYLGLGPSAHSFDSKERSWNFRSLTRYITGLKTGGKYSHREVLSPKDLFNEKIMLSLRMVKGADLNLFKNSFSRQLYNTFEQQMQRAVSNRTIIRDGDTIKIPPEKLFLSDSIIRGLII